MLHEPMQIVGCGNQEIKLFVTIKRCAIKRARFLLLNPWVIKIAGKIPPDIFYLILWTKNSIVLKKRFAMTQNYNGLGIGRHRIMELPRSTYAVYFSDTTAMLAEANKLNLKLKPEDAHAIDNAINVNFYSIRSNVGTPLVMLKVMDDAVQWCRGIDATRPSNYVRQIVAFIVTKRFGIAGDMACTGIVEQKGRYYNIYDLPNGFIYRGNMDLSHAGLRSLPNMRSVTIMGDYNISGNDLTTLNGAPSKVEGDFIIMHNANPYIFKNKPMFTKIGGKYYNDFYPNGR